MQLSRASFVASLPALVLAGIGMITMTNEANSQGTARPMTTASGLQIIDTQVGTGATPKAGQTCVMHYTGWLYENGAKGKKFDSSVDRGQPFEFPIGAGRVIKGWDEGVATMKVDGKRTLIIPAKLSKKLAKSVQEMAIEAFKAVDCSGLARVDFLMDPKSEKLFLNEINTMPGFTSISMYPKLWSASGLGAGAL